MLSVKTSTSDANKPAKTAEKLVDAKPDGDAKPESLEIKIDTTDAPELEEYGKRIQKLAIEWFDAHLKDAAPAATKAR